MQTIELALKELSLGKPQRVRNLAVFPVVGPGASPRPTT